MKRIFTLLIAIPFIFTLNSCNSTKKTQNAISTGNYQQAFDIAVQKLTKNKSKNEKQIPFLKSAFDAAAKKDKQDIKRLKSQNPKDYSAILTKYQLIDLRQDEVILLEPLYFEGKKVDFKFNDYTKKIADAKKNYSDELYAEAQKLLYSTKENAREAYAILEKIQFVNPNYRSDLSTIISNAKKKGSDYIFIELHNSVANQLKDSTSQSILQDFAKIRSGDFENIWIVLHSKKDNSVVYNYHAGIYLDKITAIPEKINQQKIPQEKEVQTGWIYKKDAKGNVMKDKEGNDIKSPRYEKIRAEVVLFQQIKSTVLDGKVILKNLKTGKSSNAVPIKGEAKLENIYGTYKGNPKAIDQKYHKALQGKKATFPPDAEFNKFALQTFKMKVEELLAKQDY